MIILLLVTILLTIILIKRNQIAIALAINEICFGFILIYLILLLLTYLWRVV